MNNKVLNPETKQKYCQDICARLNNDNNSQSLEAKLKSIIEGKYVQYNYLKEISGSKSLKEKSFMCPKNSGLISNGRNFLVPTKIDEKLKRPKKPRDMVKIVIEKPQTPVDAFICENAKSCNALDIIKVLIQKKVVNEKTIKYLIDSLDCRNKTNLEKLYNFISNVLANGDPEKSTFISYKKKNYPIGIPTCSGCDAETQKLLNLFYFSVEQKTSGSGKPHIIQQVSNELEGVEDKHAEIDVEIARNENVRKHLDEYGIGYIYSTPDTLNELDVAFGEAGPLLLKLNSESDKVIEWINKKLYQRAVALGVKRLTQKPIWSKELERVLPPTRAQFKKCKWANEYAQYSNIVTPIEYNVENVSFIPMIMEKYFAARQKAPEPPSVDEINEWRIQVKDVVSKLRVENAEYELNYTQSAFFVATAFLCSQLNDVREYTKTSALGRKIPKSIGITDEFNDGPDRIFSIAADLLARNRRMKDGISEIAGLFKEVNESRVTELLKIIILAIKTMKHVKESNEKEYPIIKATVSNGTLNMSPLYGEGTVAINLEKFKPEKAFR